jgi:uncharacterized protein
MNWTGYCFFIIALISVATPAIPATPSLQMMTGQETGTYSAFGKDIAGLAAKSGQSVKLIASNGSIDNIRRIVGSQGNIALGIVQSDILGFLQRSTNPNTKKIADHLTMVFPFYEEEVHILARKDLSGLRDLQGKRVIVGEQGSGNMLTAMNIMALSDIKAGKILHLPPAEGVVAVLSGQADAIIFVGGKPVPLFTNLAALKNTKGGKNAHLLENVHFISIDDQRVFAEYSPTRIHKEDYPFMQETILTAKVTAMLVSYGDATKTISTDSPMCKPMQQLSRTIAEGLESLQQAGHPKWKEVNLYGEISRWKRNPCVWDGKRFIPAPPIVPSPAGADNALTNDLLDVVTHGAAK